MSFSRRLRYGNHVRQSLRSSAMEASVNHLSVGPPISGSTASFVGTACVVPRDASCARSTRSCSARAPKGCPWSSSKRCMRVCHSLPQRSAAFQASSMRRKRSWYRRSHPTLWLRLWNGCARIRWTRGNERSEPWLILRTHSPSSRGWIGIWTSTRLYPASGIPRGAERTVCAPGRDVARQFTGVRSRRW